MLLRYREQSPGPGRDEVLVEIQTTSGSTEEVIVHKSFVENGSVKVEKIHEADANVLVELPRESASGNWRIWVPSAQIA